MTPDRKRRRGRTTTESGFGWGRSGALASASEGFSADDGGVRAVDVVGRLRLDALQVEARSAKLAAYESVLQRLDVTWVGCPHGGDDGDIAVAPEEIDGVREELAAKHCVPVLLPAEQLGRSKGTPALPDGRARFAPPGFSGG